MLHNLSCLIHPQPHLNTVQVNCRWLDSHIDTLTRRTKRPINRAIVAVIRAGNRNLRRGAGRAWARHGELDALSGEILDADAVALGQGASQQGSAVAARIPPLLVLDAGDC